MKNKKSRANLIIIIVFIVIGLALFGYLGYRVYNDFFYKEGEVKQLDSIELYGYALNDTDVDLYKTEFKALREILNNKEVNYEEYAKTISKMFIIDLYTINSKLGSTDIGGTEFLHKDLIENFKENIGNSLYKYVESNMKGDRTQKLPIVKEVTISDIFETKYTYAEKEYESYLVTANWTYEEDLGYQTTMKISIIKDGNMLYIVKGE